MDILIGGHSGIPSGMRIGDRVRLSEPFGWFRPGQTMSGEEAVFIATCTRITPFLSTLRSYPQAPPRACLYGVSLQNEVFCS